MDPSVKRAFCIVISALLASYGESPSADPDLEPSYAPVMTHQTKDLSMSCEELQSEIKGTEQKMRILDKQIAFHRQQNRHQGTVAPNAQTAQLDSHNSMLATAQT